MSKLEDKFAILWKAYKGPKLEREFKFLKDRKFRFDFAHEASMTACELEGGVWNDGAHSRGKHFNSDCEKYNLAAMEGWAVIRLTTNMINHEWIEFAKKLIEKRTP